MVTAELAVGILAATVLAGLLSWIVALVGVQFRCVDCANQIARQVARGDDDGVKAAKQNLPASARVDIDSSSTLTRVKVSTTWSWGRLGPVIVRGEAAIALEPGVNP